ncbi:Cyclin-T1 [Smittium mucronatum]|uniref:Cyclin-T1 n=1 Tax=Smittium mucronatum TaxID=133383 RepID=A0A1R0GVQ6_9FUNG|nr:Cyclin-T1 [Smittium mucronatum]
MHHNNISEMLRNSPSKRAGYSINEEVRHKSKACSVIQQVSTKLLLSQLTVCTACTLLHRFYLYNSLVDNHHYNTAAASLFVACKIEESTRKLEMFIPALISVVTKPLPDGSNSELLSFSMDKQPNEKLIQSAEYDTWKHIILKLEIPILICSQFNLVIEHPYTQLSKFYEGLFDVPIEPKVNSSQPLSTDVVLAPSSVRSIVERHCNFIQIPNSKDISGGRNLGSVKERDMNFDKDDFEAKRAFFLFLVWNMANSSYRVPACIIYSSTAIAIACFLASLVLITSPSGSNNTHFNKTGFSRSDLAKILVDDLTNLKLVDVSSFSLDDLGTIVNWILFVYYNDEKIKIDQQIHYHQHIISKQQKQKNQLLQEKSAEFPIDINNHKVPENFTSLMVRLHQCQCRPSEKQFSSILDTLF